MMAPLLDRLRAICLALPEASERLSHGEPWWFVRGRRAFAGFSNNHHGDGKVALWCDAPPGAQQALVASDPEQFFVPAYVGTRGWLGVRLDCEPNWEEIAALVEQAYAAAQAALPRRRTLTPGPSPIVDGQRGESRESAPAEAETAKGRR